MKKTGFKLLSTLSVLLLLTACSSLNHKIANFSSKQDPTYLTASARPALKMPAGLSRRNIKQTYPIPELPQTSAGTSPDITPVGLNDAIVLNSAEKTKPGAGKSTSPVLHSKIRAGVHHDDLGTPVLYLKTPFAQTWQRLNQILPQAGFSMIHRNQLLNSYFFMGKVGDMQAASDFQLHVQDLKTFTAVTVLDVNQHSTKSKASLVILKLLDKQWSKP